MKKFYVKDCPDHKPVHIWIGESLGMEEKFINKMKPKNPDVLYEFEDTLLDLISPWEILVPTSIKVTSFWPSL